MDGRPLNLRTPRTLLADRVAAAAENLAHHEARGLDREACLRDLIGVRSLYLALCYRLPEERRYLAAQLVGAEGQVLYRAPSDIRPLRYLPENPAREIAGLRRRELNETIRSLTVALAWAGWVGTADVDDYPREGGWYAPADVAPVIDLAELALREPETWRRALAYAKDCCRAWRADTRRWNRERAIEGRELLPVAHKCEPQLAWAKKRCPHPELVPLLAADAAAAK